MADSQQQPQQEVMNPVFTGGLNLPIGFRFHPSDYEIVNDYLTKKVRFGRNFTYDAIVEVDLNKTEPWDLSKLAKMGEKEWYFFYQKDRKYPTGPRANRATKAGYWKPTGKDKEVYKPTEGEGVVVLIGMKKTLVFYKGRAPRGEKTNWVMHEYRLESSEGLPSQASASSSSANTVVAMKASASASKDEWVVCRVFDKTTRIKKTTLVYQVAMADIETDQNQNNIPASPILMPLPLLEPMPMHLPILPDFTMDPVAPSYPNTSAGIPMMMPPTTGIGGASGLQINGGALFGNPIAAPLQMNFYHQMGMGAAADQMGMGTTANQMGTGAASLMNMGATGANGFIVATLESRLSPMASQKDEQVNAAEISSLMSVTGPGSATATIEMDGIWKYKY